ncbi:MAG: biosynthetic-type acetolactate synthase large subunit [archaeon]|jgi:acetolactate synthase-1/2/3 large subunit
MEKKSGNIKGTTEIINALIKNDVKHLFGFPGGSVMPLYDDFLNYQKELRHILVRHEQAAAHAADAYARVTGKAGVCLTTSGPGATNIVTGLMSAYMDSVPVVALSGNVPTTLLGMDAFQETDMIGITMPITKHNYQIRHPNEINNIINNAFHIATTGRPGPVFIDMPKDIQTNEVTKQNPTILHKGFKPNMHGHPAQISKAANEILNAKRPVILAGGGVIISRAHNELATLATGLNIPVTTTYMGKGCFDERHPLSLGVIGMHGRKVANYALANADIIIAIGCRFSDRITGKLSEFCQDGKIIHIDIDSAEIGKNVPAHLPIVGDAKNILTELNIAIKKKAPKNKEWSEKIKSYIRECNCNYNISGTPIDPRKIMHEINLIVKDDDIVTTGTGQHQMFAAHFLKRSKPGTIITSGGSGTMGFGFPAAIGAKIAAPKKEVFDIDGDGSFAMVIQELATCKEENIKTIPIIFNNAYLGMVRQWQELFFEKRYASTKLNRTPDFAKVAEAYNLTGISVDRDSEIKEALTRAYKNDQTTVLDIMIGEETNILPMFGPSSKHTDMFGGCIQNVGELF